MKTKTIVYLYFLLSTSAVAQTNFPNNDQLKTTFELISIISADSLEGRKPGSIGMEKATRFIENYFKTLGIKPFFKNSYLDTLLVMDHEAYNVVGILNPEAPSDTFILIGAHLDHLGKIKNKNDSVYNGANDNASGVTAVLQISRALKGLTFNKKIIVAIFTGEESGLLGSKHLARRLKQKNIPLSFVLNIEMIGHPLSDTPNQIYITGYEKSDFAVVSNKLLGRKFIVHKQFSTRLFPNSDNYPFYSEFKIPSHTLSTYDFRNDAFFHKPGDEASNLNIGHMDKIINNIAGLITLILTKSVTFKNTQPDYLTD